MRRAARRREPHRLRRQTEMRENLTNDLGLDDDRHRPHRRAAPLRFDVVGATQQVRPADGGGVRRLRGDRFRAGLNQDPAEDRFAQDEPGLAACYAASMSGTLVARKDAPPRPTATSRKPVRPALSQRRLARLPSGHVQLATAHPAAFVGGGMRSSTVTQPRSLKHSLPVERMRPVVLTWLVFGRVPSPAGTSYSFFVRRARALASARTVATGTRIRAPLASLSASAPELRTRYAMSSPGNTAPRTSARPSSLLASR